MELSKTFKDALDREWTVDITTATLRRLAAAPLSFSLNDLISNDIDPKNPAAAVKKYQQFLDDDLRFAEVLFAILKPTADLRGISQDQFEEGLKGEGNQRAVLGFHAAYTDFSHGPRKMILRTLKVQMDKQTKFHEIANRKIEAEAANMTEAKMEAMLEKAIQHARQEQEDGPKPESEADQSLKLATDTAAPSV